MSVATAGAVIAGAACDDGSETDNGPDAADGGVDSGADVGADGSDAGTGDAHTGADAGASLLDGAAFFPLSLASGDPKPTSVVLWTRAEDPEAAEDLCLMLELALDEAFTELIELDGAASLEVEARAEDDGCVKVRLTDLTPSTTYYYRFVYHRADGAYVTRTGRTRTAPEPDADVSARFAFVSCQDFNGKYYNAYERLLLEDLDFVVHLGDYVYETTGDPSFQDTAPGRVVSFTDTEGAIDIEEGDSSFQAARSLDNYRELYRTFRGDEVLQRVHERFAFVCIWDDHEFADDCHGANATHTSGRFNEEDVERRQNANQAWFEYMPVDYLDPEFHYDRGVAPPNDIRIFRDLRYGAHVHLVMTDLRLYRPDHPVPEDAFPGAVVLNEAQLREHEGGLPEWADAYVDVDTYADGAYADALIAGADAGGYRAEDVGGPTAVRFINGVVEALIEAGVEGVELIDESGDLEFERGLAYISLGKGSAFSSIGSRYLAIRAPYRSYARHLYQQSEGASEESSDDEQRPAPSGNPPPSEPSDG